MGCMNTQFPRAVSMLIGHYAGRYSHGKRQIDQKTLEERKIQYLGTYL